MNSIILGILIAVIFIAAHRIYKYLSHEGYENIDQKATTIAAWWSSPGDHTYSRYKQEVPNSDIVEYMSAKNAKNSGGTISSADIKKILN